MATFRGLGLPGDYFLEFDLEVLPRKGERSVVTGRMWGSRTIQGPVFRASINAPVDGAESEVLLGQNGPESAAWRYQADEPTAQVERLSAAQLLDPIGATNLSMFELQMPFVYWDDFVYEGVTKVRGRAVHAFLMYPPAEFAAAHDHIAGVRLHLDAQFNALVQAVILDADEQPQRKLTVLDLKKLGDQWIVKSIDVREEATRDKVRFEVTGAALDLDFAPGLFAPAALSDAVRSPARVERF
ncbi:hypothetical protein [Synoicihabitans lomoniglobus]|uniref:Uncharacterized protein n=1 Tax=Synoicihabitans lomoniglobus TaxID=2909285 RepID=A0AAF0CRT7_9BACT|nr:hypothetical protein [Opitutaceae bacterium LMO-M01]WED66881.1 hypothetical protein PXH66_08465 [Opitutaceae bacterium LMO-M01]